MTKEALKVKMEESARATHAPEGEQVEAPSTESPVKNISPEVFIDPKTITPEQVAAMQRKLRELEELKGEKRTAHVNLILRPSRLNRFKTMAKQDKKSNSAFFEELVDAAWNSRKE